MPRSRSLRSPPGVVGPFAASTRNLHCSSPALSSVTTPPMAAGTNTSHGSVRISALSIFSPAPKSPSWFPSGLCQKSKQQSLHLMSIQPHNRLSTHGKMSISGSALRQSSPPVANPSLATPYPESRTSMHCPPSAQNTIEHATSLHAMLQQTQAWMKRDACQGCVAVLIGGQRCS